MVSAKIVDIVRNYIDGRFACETCVVHYFREELIDYPLFSNKALGFVRVVTIWLLFMVDF